MPMVSICGKLLLWASSCLVTAAGGSTSERETFAHVQSRPIVTGCLDSCGFEDTQCVTECQVCVEHHSCGVVTKCDVCEKQVLATRRAAIKSDVRAVDSGGKSLIHEGLRVKLLTAKMDRQDAQHALLFTRDQVITAQTTADYYTQQRSQKKDQLGAAREKKVGAKKKVHKWSKKNMERLERAKRRLHEAEQEEAEEQKKMKEAKAELRDAHLRVKKAKKDDADEKVLKKAELDEWTAQRRVEEEKQKVEDLKDSVVKRKREAKWVDRHLRQQVEGKQDDIESAAAELQQAEIHEKEALHALTQKREDYRQQIKRTEAAENRVERLEKEVDEHPLPEKATPDRRAAFRSMGLGSSVGLLPFLSLWIAL